ncbi:hypothetical protein INT45_000544 [Circinella minor]|uniref:Xylanolytic transcriptional activator regulatory domain-containing protein n=1 Tax=Circinella minor TaxID=1195481 RepID=A0A8H7SC12_9FUNG|nr:hypothetical protein INT45_000544 [Circinella minor]
MNPLLRYAVYALGCLYNNPEDRTAQLWFEKACSLVDHEINVSLSTVQALAIMCWYTYLTGDLQQCNQLRRQLYRALLDCNLNQETTTNFSVVEQEMRRRGLWASYVIDQWLSVCTGERVQPPMITSTWNVKLPKLEDSQLYAIDVRNLQPMSIDLQELSVESALQVAVFSEMVKLVQVVSCSCDGRNAKAALTEWLLHLPPYLEFGKATDDSPPSPIARIFHLLYYTVQVIINRPTEAAISPSTITSYQYFPSQQQQQQEHQQVINHTVDQYGTTAANTIIHIAEQMVQCNQTKYLYNVFGLSLSLAATIHLENARLFDSTFTNNNLTRSMNVVKQTNCTIVPHVDLDRILHRFVDNRCGVVLDHYYNHNSSLLQHQQQQQLRPSLHQTYPFADLVPTSSKRPHLGDELERAVKRPSFDFSRWLPPEQQQYTIPSLSETGNYNNLVDLFITTSPASTTSTSNHNSNTSTIKNGIDMTTAVDATEVSLQTDYWSTEQNLFSNPPTGMSSSTSSSSSPLVTPKPVTTNPSPVLTLITTPIETPTASYFSPHVTNNDSPSMLSAQKGFELTKDNNLRELISDNFYSAIDF